MCLYFYFIGTNILTLLHSMTILTIDMYAAVVYLCYIYIWGVDRCPVDLFLKFVHYTKDKRRKIF